MLLRRLALRWGWVVGLVLLVGLVAALGGFGRAPGTGPRRFGAGEAIELTRWTVAVDSVELVDTTTYGSPSPPTLRLHLRVTWTGDATADLLTPGLVSVVVPGGPAPAEEVDAVAAGPYSGGFDPDVPRPADLEVVWPAGADENETRLPAPALVQVVVHDEREAQNFLFSDEWTTTAPLGHVDVAPTDSRSR